MREEIRLAGFGGQGVVLAGYILGKAIAIYDGKNAIFTQSYGPEARGGACSAELVVSDEEIDYPLISRPQVLVLLSQEAFQKYGPLVNEGGIVVIDSYLVHTTTEGKRVYRMPFTRMAEELGNRIAANIVMLGFLTAVSGIVSKEAMEESIRTTVSPRTVELNLRAFAAGYALAKTPEAVA